MKPFENFLFLFDQYNHDLYMNRGLAGITVKVHHQHQQNFPVAIKKKKKIGAMNYDSFSHLERSWFIIFLSVAAVHFIVGHASLFGA